MLGLAVVSSSPAVAYAHPLIEEAARHYESADFEGALAALSRAERADDLRREDLVQLLIQRAVISLALGREAQMRADMAALVSIAPMQELGREIPPQVREAFADALGEDASALTVRATLSPMEGGGRVSAEVTGDPTGVTRAIRVAARAAGAEWRRGEGSVAVETLPGATIEFFAEAVGPGGAVLATDGTEADPRRGSAAAAAATRVEEAPAEDGGTGLLIGLVAGGAALLVLGVVLVAVLASGGTSDQTQFGPPMVQWP